MKIILILFLGIAFAFSSVKINSASAEEFVSLVGVGVKKAQNIVKYREFNGCFKSISDLSMVKGIANKTIEKNKKMLVLDKCPNKSSKSKKLKISKK